MSQSLEEKLEKWFQPEELAKTFHNYKEFKRDRFTEDVKICMGADGNSYEKIFKYEDELKRRCELISRRVLNGTYLFYPGREIDIRKNTAQPFSQENKRTLSIAAIRDIIVQKNLYNTVYDDIESLFSVPKIDQVSCAYRKGKSAPNAAKLIHRYIKQDFTFVLDADIIKFFDNICHTRLLNLIQELFGESPRVYKLLLRFIKTPTIPSRDKQQNRYPLKDFYRKKFNRQELAVRKANKGLPQGGILSGMLANLYLHEFDCWVVEELSRQYQLRYVRYADDFVILLKKESDISKIHSEVSKKLENDLKLKLHDLTRKTRYVNIAQEHLNFVGFRFTLREIYIREENIEKFKKRILDKIQEEPERSPQKNYPKAQLNFFITKLNLKIVGTSEPIKCLTCGEVLTEKVRSWISFFSIITDTKQLRYLDKWIRRTVSAHFYKKYNFRLKPSHFRNASLASLEKEYYRIRGIQFQPCSCKREESNLTLPETEN